MRKEQETHKHLSSPKKKTLMHMDVPGLPLHFVLAALFPSGGGEQLGQSPCVAEHLTGRLFYSSAGRRPLPFLGNGDRGAN